MRFKKLLSTFAASLMLLGVQNANAAVSLTYVGDYKNNNKLVDGNRNQKWEGDAGNDMWCIFKTSVPIKATSYTLTTGGDNASYTGRNWKNWTVYGGNFANDNAAKAAVRSTEGGWVALDIRENDDILQDKNTTDFDFTMTNSDNEHFYTYYLVKATSTKGANWMQMGEFAFKNYTVDTSAYDDVIASAKSFDTSNADNALQTEYANLVSTLDDLKAAAAVSSDFDNLDAAIAKVNILQKYINSYASNSYLVLSTVGDTWGDGVAANLLDGKPGTKWGGGFTSGNIVWRVKEAIQPLYYQLTAGGDTSNNSHRNWKSWAIYGANFTSVLDATANAAEWVELYYTEDGGMTSESGKTQDFDFTKSISESYQYFKVVLLSTTDPSRNQQQMADLNIIDGTTFNNNKAAAIKELQDFQSKYDYSEATDEMKNTFETAITTVSNSTYKNLTENVTAAWAAEKVMADYLASDDKFGAESVNISSGLDADVFTRNIPAVGDVDIIEGFDNNTTGFYTKTVKNTSTSATQTTTYGVPDDGILKTSSGHTYAFSYDDLNAVSIKKGETKTMTLDGERQSKSWRFYFLGTASNGPADMTATFSYKDGTTSTAKFQIYNWDTNNDVTRAVTVYQTGRVFNGNLSDGNNNFRFFEIPAFVDQNKVITNISLYNSGETNAKSKAMVFGFCIVGKDDSAEMFYMGSNGYATYVPQVKDIDLSSFNNDDLAAYTVSIAPEGWANLTQVTKIPTGSAVVMKGKAGSYKLPYTTGADKLTGNVLKAAENDVVANGTQYILAQVEGEVAFHQATENSVIPAGKGYLELDGAGPQVKAFFGDEESETAITNVNVNGNGNNAAIYNMAGQRISKLQKGVNIVNGRKVLY
jgi:hypothetical protein